ncbi:MAG TPA: aminotransferase [Clostridiales bacterium]|nr:aminotransferase [Clostridiales bacterium]
MKDLSTVRAEYEKIRSSGARLDMSRGKPNKEQLDLSNGLLTCLREDEFKASDGTDCRNYGGLDGLPEAKQLLHRMLDVGPDEIIIGGNSSLNLMFDMVGHAMLRGVYGVEKPWAAQKPVFLCPAPGYDRHFAICEHFGIEMLPIPMLKDGPDMDLVEDIAGSDVKVKGIWCTPKYSNPTGVTYSDEVVRRLAAMKPKADDFRIFWDNAYAIHSLGTPEDLMDILSACRDAGNEDRVFIFGSTSKVTFAGAGVAMMGASTANLNFIRKRLSKQTIGPDKVNQLRHVKFFGNYENILKHMEKHAAIIKPKFDLVTGMLEQELGSCGLASWSQPAGGYFISLNTLPGKAKKVYDLAAAAGLVLTRVGDTFPYGKDPEDQNIRIAPTFPSLEEMEKAMELLLLCIRLA